MGAGSSGPILWVGKISYLSAQDEHKTDPDSLRIIMDVFLRDENRIITVEMQTGHKTELPNYQSVADVSTTKLFLNTATEQLRDLDQELRLFYDYVRGSPAQTNFTKELDVAISRMKQEKEERNMYLTYTSRMMEFRRDGLEEGISIGLTQGREEGAYQNKLETAKMLLSCGDSPEKVARCTNLSLETVLELAQEL